MGSSSSSILVGPCRSMVSVVGRTKPAGSSGIRLVTEAEAMEFMEAHGTSDDYVKLLENLNLGRHR
jgi:hypothetical protein